MKQKLILPVGLIFILAMGLILTCSDDCPTCPKDSTPPLGHYRLYAYDGMSGFLMSVDIPADTIVDSVQVGYSGNSIFVTPDGKTLLVMYSYQYVNKMELYNTADLSHIGSLDQYGPYYFDGGDNYGICLCNGIHFIDPSTLLPTDSIDLFAGLGYLDTVANQFFAVSGATIYKIDCNTRTIVDSFPDMYGGNVQNLAYNRLTNDIYYFSMESSWSAFFFQYSCDADSIIGSNRITSGGGGISIAPDCQRIYVTDAGNGMLMILPPGQIWVFDALTNKVLTWIPPFDPLTGAKIAATFGDVVITPDNSRAYVGTGMSSGGGSPIAVVDLNTNRIINIISPYLGFSASGIALGPVPGE